MGKGFDRHLTNSLWVTDKSLQRCSTPLVAGHVHSRTTARPALAGAAEAAADTLRAAALTRPARVRNGATAWRSLAAS